MSGYEILTKHKTCWLPAIAGANQLCKMIHRAIFRLRELKYDNVKHYRILNLSITQDQANIVFNNCLSLIKGKRLVELLVDNISHTPYPKIVFGNGAEIIARSSQNRGEYLLGHDFDYINFDEVAFELHPEYIVEEVLSMRLADRKGMLDLTSTPCGKNWFYQRYLQLKEDRLQAYVQSGKSIENSHLSGEYLQSLIKRLTKQRVSQNICGLFVDSGDEILKEEYIQKAFLQATGLTERIMHHKYLHGWDLARKLTFTVGVTLDITEKPYQLVAFERFQKRNWQQVSEAIRQRQKKYGGITVIDSTGLGDVILSGLSDIKPQGFIFTERSKAELLTNMQTQFEDGNLGIPAIEQDSGDQYWSMISELREVCWSNNNKCDAIMALSLALWSTRPQDKNELRPLFRYGEI